MLTPGAGNDRPKLDILDAKFYCSFVKATQGQHLAMMQSVLTKPVHYENTYVTAKTFAVAAGSESVTLDNIYMGPIPNRILMVMVADDALGGTYGTNPFNFQHFNLKSLAIMVNSKMIPNPPYEPSFAAGGQYLRTYAGMLEGLNKMFSEHPIPLSPKDFKGGYAIWPFDLTPDQNCERSHSPQGHGNIRILVRFATGLTAAIVLCLLAEYDAWIEIDKYKNVTTSFNQ